MTHYETLKHKPKRFLALTGQTLEEFSALLPSVSKRFLACFETQTLDGKPRKKRRYTSYQNSCLPSFEEKLLFILLYLRQAMTQEVLGELFEMSQPLANIRIHRLLPILNRTFADLGEVPSRERSPSDVQDSTETSETDAQVCGHFFS